MSRRLALIIGTSEYQNSQLSQLKGPEADVKGLAALLSRSDIGAYDEAKPLINVPLQQARIEIADFYDRKSPDDLLLLYYSGHGQLDDRRRLYLATCDTDPDALRPTAIAASEIIGLMDESRSRQQVLVLDCCYSGAFSKGAKAAIGEPIEIASHFGGSTTFSGDGQGRVVLTAANSTQYAWEGDRFIGSAQNSLFTHYMIRGLKTGEADKDGDGVITTDELYAYVYDQVARKTKKVQTPQKWSYQQQGRLTLMGSPRGQRTRAPASEPTKPRRPTRKAKRSRFRISVAAANDLASTVQSDICPLLKDLGQSGAAQNLTTKAIEIESAIAKQPSSPVMLLGTTGAGKTSLMNAILGQILGASGGGGAQSAASLRVSHGAEQYVMSAEYLSLEDIHDFLEQIKFRTDKKNLLKRPDEQKLTPFLESLLSVVKPALRDAPPEELEIRHLENTVADLVKRGTSRGSFPPKRFADLVEAVKDHTNSRGKLWTITKEVQVAGPFPELRKNVLMMDLPGLGDINRMRVDKTRNALKDARQVLVVVGERGLTEEVKEMLDESKMVSHMLTLPSIPQITFVGTKLDDTAQVGDIELRELGLEEDCSLSDIARAKFRRWKSMIKNQWTDILQTSSASTRASGRGDYNAVEDIIASTDFIPCSPLGYLCLAGLQRDRTGLFERIFATNGQADLAATGIPAVRKSIDRLAAEQEKLREGHIRSRAEELQRSLRESCEPFLKTLLQRIKITDTARKQLEDRLEALADGQPNSQLDLYETARKTNAKLRESKSIIHKGWQDMDRGTLEKMYHAHLGAAHFQTVMAALRRSGRFKSQGKREVVVNIPSKTGRYIVDPLTAYVNNKVLPPFVKAVASAVEARRKAFVRSIEKALGGRTKNKSDALTSLQEQKNGILADHSSNVTALVDSTDSAVDKLKTNVSQMGYDSVADGLQSIMYATLAKAKGPGARRKAILKLADLSDQMMPDIQQRISDEFGRLVGDQIDDICVRLVEETENQEDSVIRRLTEVGNALLASHDNEEQRKKAAQLDEVLKSI